MSKREKSKLLVKEQYPSFFVVIIISKIIVSSRANARKFSERKQLLLTKQKRPAIVLALNNLFYCLTSHILIILTHSGPGFFNIICNGKETTATDNIDIWIGLVNALESLATG